MKKDLQNQRAPRAALKRIRKTYAERDSVTKRRTLELFQQNHDAETIALLRRLSLTSVETHLAFYVKTGAIPIQQLVAPEKVSAIQAVVERLGSRALTPVKQSLGRGFSFGEVRFVVAFLESRSLKEAMS
jgi:ATP-dependent DNA helicase RecQ